MNYSVNKLTSTADCDVMVDLAEKTKDDLQYRKTIIVHQNVSFSGTATEVEAELSAVTTQKNALATVVAALPDGAVKNSNVTKLKRLELKEYLLTQKKDNYGSVALLENEFEQARIDLEIAEADAFIAALNARKAVLSA